MRRLISYLIFALLVPTMAQESKPSLPSANLSLGSQGGINTQIIRQLTWIGFETKSIEPAIRAQLPKLPMGVGFLISKIEPHSPAEKTGLLVADVVWKFDDQLLINQAQLIVLLQMHKPNEEIKLTVFRGGEEKTFPLVLGSAPAQQKLVIGPTIESTITQAPLSTGLAITPAPEQDNSTASMDDGDNVLEMEMREEGPWLTITDETSQIAYDGLADDAHLAKVPAKWKKQALSLRNILSQKKEVVVPK